MKFASIFSACLLAGALSSCGTVKKVTQIPVPFLGQGEEEKAEPFEDRDVPYQFSQSLGAGHTLKFSVYSGQHNPKRLYSGTVVVDDAGKIDLKKHGEVQVGGLKAHEAAKAIGAEFRRTMDHLVINVQLEEIEGHQLVLVEGAVKSPGAASWYDGANTLDLLKYVGGRDGKSTGQAIYITRDGRRKFYPTAATTEGGHVLEAGDIIHYSSEL